MNSQLEEWVDFDFSCASPVRIPRGKCRRSPIGSRYPDCRTLRNNCGTLPRSSRSLAPTLPHWRVFDSIARAYVWHSRRPWRVSGRQPSHYSYQRPAEFWCQSNRTWPKESPGRWFHFPQPSRIDSFPARSISRSRNSMRQNPGPKFPAEFPGDWSRRRRSLRRMALSPVPTPPDVPCDTLLLGLFAAVDHTWLAPLQPRISRVPPNIVPLAWGTTQ